MAKRTAKVIADEIDEIAASVGPGYGRRLGRLAAELRGEEVAPTPNEQRAAERAKAAEAEAAEVDSKA